MTNHHRPASRPDTSPASITEQLDREWERLRRRARSISTVHSWGPQIDHVIAASSAGVSPLDAIVEATHARHGVDGERLLRHLVSLAPHDQLAGQIVVRRLLPGVLAAVVRYGRLCDHGDPVAEAMGALWISITSFDGERRRGPVAASIISDTMFTAFRRRLRLKSADERPVEPTAFDDQADAPARCAFVELAGVVREARLGGVPASDLDLLRHLARADTARSVAHDRHVSTRTIRNHRTRAVARVRAAIAA